MAERQFMNTEDLERVVRAVFGTSISLTAVERLAGGSKKGVYRLSLSDGASNILYAWNDDENYWADNVRDPRDPFAEASGIDLFESASTALAAAGVRVPALLFVDRSRALYPADLVLAEDLPGGTLEALIKRDREAASPLLRELGTMLTAMAAQHSPHLGKVAAVASGVAPQDRRAEAIVFEQALRHLALVADRVPALGAERTRIEDRVRTLVARIRPRDYYSLIHGELGADHVMIDGDNRPVIIDIEGVMYFDAEWEHDFTRMRFGEAYDGLGLTVDLDPARMDLYVLARSLSLVEGPLRIAETDYPGRDFMLEIATWHTGKVLRLSA